MNSPALCRLAEQVAPLIAKDAAAATWGLWAPSVRPADELIKTVALAAKRRLQR
jgi:hypothetical protein